MRAGGRGSGDGRVGAGACAQGLGTRPGARPRARAMTALAIPGPAFLSPTAGRGATTSSSRARRGGAGWSVAPRLVSAARAGRVWAPDRIGCGLAHGPCLFGGLSGRWRWAWRDERGWARRSVESRGVCAAPPSSRPCALPRSLPARLRVRAGGCGGHAVAHGPVSERGGGSLQEEAGGAEILLREVGADELEAGGEAAVGGNG